MLLDLLERTDLTMISGHPVYDMDPPSGDPKEADKKLSPVTFIGDSIHAMSPFKGQGANVALIDSMSLAKALSSLCQTGRNFLESKDEASLLLMKQNICSALETYEESMKKRASTKVIKSRMAAKYLHSEAALTHANITRAAAAEAVSEC